MDMIKQKPMCFALPVGLFILLTPGLFFELNPSMGRYKIEFRQSMIAMTLTHAAVFLLAYVLIRKMYPAIYGDPEPMYEESA